MANTVYDIEGVVTHIGEEMSFAEGRFKKKEFVVTVKSDYQGKVYEDHILLETHNDGMYQLTGTQEGNKVRAGFVIQGRAGKGQHEGKYFNTLKAIRIETLEATTTEQRAQNTAQQSQQQEVDDFVEDGPIDELPF